VIQQKPWRACGDYISRLPYNRFDRPEVIIPFDADQEETPAAAVMAVIIVLLAIGLIVVSLMQSIPGRS
jgi:hypothetical protein